MPPKTYEVAENSKHPIRTAEIGVDSTMKQECDISMKRSEITDEEFSGVSSTLKAVTYWVQLFTKKCV